MKILIFAKHGEKGIECAKKLSAELEEHGKHEVFLDKNTSSVLGRQGKEPDDFSGDIILTLGGDGTFLSAVHRASVPVIGIKTDGFGYLCAFEFDRFMSIASKKDFTKELLSRDAMRIRAKAEGFVSPPALNDIVIARRVPDRAARIRFSVDDTEFNFKGDGVIFATPTGSTGYALSAGGTVVDRTLEAIEIVPVCPFNSRVKPMIVGHGTMIRASCDSGLVIADGLWKKEIENTEIEIGVAEPLKMLLPRESSFRRFKRNFL